MASNRYRDPFDIPPRSVIWGLAVSGISALGVFVTGLMLWLGTGAFPTLLGVTTSSSEFTIFNGSGVAALALFWGALGLTAVYRALRGSSLARFVVVSFAGITFLTYTINLEKVGSFWSFLILITILGFLASPIFTLTSRKANQFFGSY